MNFIDIVKNRNVYFITTKNIDYIRNSQEIRLLREKCRSLVLIYSEQKKYFLRVFMVWFNILKTKFSEGEIVFIGFAPQLVVPFWGWKFKKNIVVIDFFISLYDTFVCDRKVFREGGLLAKFCHKLDEITLNAASYVVADTKAHASFFSTEFSIPLDKFEVIYLEADDTLYYPREIEKPNQLKDKYVVLYFGSILPLQGVDIVLDTIREFSQMDNIYFDIIGPIPTKYKKPIQNNVSYSEWLTQEELAKRIALADLCLAGHFNSKIEKANRTIPGKAYIYEKMNKAMILGDSKANRELFTDDDRHIFVEMGSVESLKNAILRKKENYEIN